MDKKIIFKSIEISGNNNSVIKPKIGAKYLEVLKETIIYTLLNDKKIILSIYGSKKEFTQFKILDAITKR